MPSSFSIPIISSVPTPTSLSSLPTQSMSTSTTLPSSVPFPPISLSTTSRIAYLSSTTTSLVACLTIMIALMYLVILSWAVRYAKENPKVVNKVSGVWVVRYAPVGYAFLVLSSLIEVAFSSWLILQWRFNHSYPNTHTRAGTRLLLFASSWTTLTAGVYTLLFIHQAWSRLPISSIGAQAIWVLLTWLFWVVGAGVVNASVPTLLDKGRCGEVVYCAQIRGLFGMAVIESLALSAGLLVLSWLAWQSTSSTLRPVSFRARLSRATTFMSVI